MESISISYRPAFEQLPAVHHCKIHPSTYKNFLYEADSPLAKHFLVFRTTVDNLLRFWADHPPINQIRHQPQDPCLAILKVLSNSHTLQDSISSVLGEWK
jgi:hypothetical protein